MKLPTPDMSIANCPPIAS